MTSSNKPNLDSEDQTARGDMVTVGGRVPAEAVANVIDKAVRLLQADRPKLKRGHFVAEAVLEKAHRVLRRQRSERRRGAERRKHAA